VLLQRAKGLVHVSARPWLMAKELYGVAARPEWVTANAPTALPMPWPMECRSLTPPKDDQAMAEMMNAAVEHEFGKPLASG
jgi:hypothetical protein